MIKSEKDGVKLMVVDDLSPEDLAMLQAFYSRSAESAEVALNKIYAGRRSEIETTLKTWLRWETLEAGYIPLPELLTRLADTEHGRSGRSEKFMKTHYVGYNHKSIADCGTTTMFIEGVSLLTAKAIQDWPLYSGQETSTRYIDMSKQRIINPYGTAASRLILDNWMSFYIEMQGPVLEYVREQHPRRPDEKEDNYERALKARAFDITRGFLPAGVCTQLSWHTNIRQAGDHLLGLCEHPVAEPREVGLELRGLLSQAHPSSGMGLSLPGVSGVARSDGEVAREQYNRLVAQKYTYPTDTALASNRTSIKSSSLSVYEDLLRTRPRGAVLPHFLSDLGLCSFSGLIDFGSFRDLQRHRNGVCRMPLLTNGYGFHRWYVEQLPLHWRERALDFIRDQEANMPMGDAYASQYYIPLGALVPYEVTYALPATVYVLELRSAKTVHPTLRREIHNMLQSFKSWFGDRVSLHVDTDLDDWDVRRGQQTILVK
jgi:thymidylate synthase ThyX